MEKGADPTIIDDYGATPLCTAAGTGGASSIDILVKYGANINHKDFISTTPLHACFFRGTLECLKVLLKYKPDPTILMNDELLPIESAFRDDMSHMIEYIINNDTYIKIDEGNIMRLVECAIMFKADKCLELLIELDLNIQYGHILMIKLVADNYMHPNESISRSLINIIYSKING